MPSVHAKKAPIGMRPVGAFRSAAFWRAAFKKVARRQPIASDTSSWAPPQGSPTLLFTQTNKLMSITRSTVVKTWGLAVLIGWVGSQVITSLSSIFSNVPFAITALWLVGALFPITVSFFWDRPEPSDQTLSLLWPALGVTGILINFGVSLGAIPAGETIGVLAYGVLWFAGPGIGFAATAALTAGPNASVYGWAAVANFAGAVAALVAPTALLPVYFLGAAVLQATPMLYDGFSG